MWGEALRALGAVTALCVVWGMGRAYWETRALARVVEARWQIKR